MTNRMLLLLTSIVTLLALNAAPLAAQPLQIELENPAPERVLLVGSSYFHYNDILHNHVSRMLISLATTRGSRCK